MARITNPELALPATLDLLARLVDESQSGPAVAREIRDRGRARALELIEAIGPGERASAIAAVAFAADMFGAIAVDLAANPPDAARLIERFEEITDVSRVALGREVLRWPQLAQISTEVAFEVQLVLLLTFIEVEAVSLWTVWPDGGLSASPTPAAQRRARSDVATQLLHEDWTDLAEFGSDLGIRLERPPRPCRGADRSRRAAARRSSCAAARGGSAGAGGGPRARTAARRARAHPSRASWAPSSDG